MVSGETREKLIRVCSVLAKHGVDYLVVGGAAVNFYGHRRPSIPATSQPELTIDLDFWYNPTIENFHKLVEALGDLEVDTTELKKVVFDPKSTYLKIPHDTFHTDFLPNSRCKLLSRLQKKCRESECRWHGNTIYFLQ